MSSTEIDFTVTAKGEIELLAESRGLAWHVVISRGGKVRFLRNLKIVDSFPSTPLTKRLVAATEAILPEAVRYLEESWKQGILGIRNGIEIVKPWDTAEGRESWWNMKNIVRGL